MGHAVLKLGVLAISLDSIDAESNLYRGTARVFGALLNLPVTWFLYPPPLPPGETLPVICFFFLDGVCVASIIWAGYDSRKSSQ